MLCGENCDFVTDVSGQPIGPIIKSEAVREKIALLHDCVKLYLFFGRHCSIALCPL